MNYSFYASAKHLLLLAVFLFVGFTQVFGQAVSAYIPLITSGTYTSLGTNGTEILGNVDDGNSSATNIGFTFNLGGQSFTQFVANSNGHIRLGGIVPTVNHTPLSTTSNTYSISAAGRDGRSTGAVRYFLSGTAPNRVGIIQYTNYDLVYNATTRRVSFQIRLYEGTNVIEIIYTGVIGNTTTQNIQVGLRGSSTAADVRNYSGSSNGWATLTAGTTNTSTIPWGSSQNATRSMPSNGRILRWTPPVVDYRHQYNSISSGSSSWCSGETRTVTVNLTNNGAQPWTSGWTPPNSVNFSWWGSWQTGQDDNPRILPFSNLIQNSSQDVSFSVTAPVTPGIYTINSDLVRDGVCWFRGNAAPSCGPGNSLFTSSTFTVVGTPGNAASPVPVNSATGVCYIGNGAVTALSWVAVSGATGYDVYGGTVNPPVDLLSSNQAGTSFTLPIQLLPSTTYYWRVAPRNACGVNNSGSVWSFTTANAPCYCVSNGTTSTSGAVTFVGFNTISNATPLSCSATSKASGYSNFTNISTTLAVGATYNLSTRINTDYAWDYYTFFGRAWIDWNQDGDFTDVGEEYNLGSVFDVCDGAPNLSPLAITVPSSALSGNTRMRVSARKNAYSTSCLTGIDGEVEDYTINVINPEYRVEWVSMNYGSSNWCIGDSRTVSVTLKNVGTKTWNTDYTTNVGVKWNANGGNWGDYHVRLSVGNLVPGATQTYNFTLPALNATAGSSFGGNLPLGANNITFDIVNEGNCWFGGNGGVCGPGNDVYTSPSIQIQPAPTANAGLDKLIPCASGVVLDGSSNNETLFTEDFGNGTPLELSNTTSNWRIFYRVGSQPGNRTRWWINNNAANYPCLSGTSGSAIVMQDPIVSNRCDYAWDDGVMDEVVYNINPIDGSLYSNVNLSFYYVATGERNGTTVRDYFQVVYSLDNGVTWISMNTGNNGAGYTFNNNNGVNNGFFSLATTPASPNITPASGTHNADISFLAGQKFLLGFRWYNNNDNLGNYSNFLVDNIIVTGTANYSWSPTAGVTNNLTKSPTVTLPSTYTVLVTAGNGCTATDQVIVTNTTLPAVPLVTNTSPACPNQTIDLSAQGLAPGGKVVALTGSNTITPGITPNINNNFTMEFWVNPTKTRVTSTEVSTGVSTNLASNTDQSFVIYPDQRGAVASGAGVSVGTNGISVFEHGDGYLPSTLVYDATISGWTHVAVVYINRIPSLFVNGVLVKTGVISGRATVHPSLGTGLAYGFFNGSFDNLRVWNSARTASQISANMFLEVPATTPDYLFSFDNSSCIADVGNVTNTASGVTYTDANYYTYTWSGGAGLPSPTANMAEIRTTPQLAPATYNYSVTASSGTCNGTPSNTVAEVKTNNQTASSWNGTSTVDATDWFDSKNWSNCTPGNQTVVTISRGKPSYPVITNTSTFDINPKGKAKAKKVTLDTSGSGAAPTLNINTDSELRVNE